MIQDLSGKTALITGGTSGIGRETARQLAARGAHVIVAGRNEERGAAAVQELRAAGANADFVRVELGNTESVRELARKATELGDGHVDIFVNSAAIFPFAPTAETTEATFDETYAINVRAPFYLVAELAPAMAERGDGAIVNLSTMVAQYGEAGMPLYGSTKAALVLLTKSWAAEFGPRGVRVNAVSPGPTLTEGTAGFESFLEQQAALAPGQRVGTPEDVASAIAFLVSPAASHIHGVVLPVDGGRLAV